LTIFIVHLATALLHIQSQLFKFDPPFALWTGTLVQYTFICLCITWLHCSAIWLEEHNFRCQTWTVWTNKSYHTHSFRMCCKEMSLRQNFMWMSLLVCTLCWDCKVRVLKFVTISRYYQVTNF